MNVSNKTLWVERLEGTLILTLNIPERRNALSLEVRQLLLHELQVATTDETIRAIIITGAKAVFCSGGDLTAMNVSNLSEGIARMKVNAALIRALVCHNKPVIAAVEGVAAGAGFSLALACDFIVASEQARFISSFGKVGLMPDLGLLYTLPKRTSEAVAKRLIFSGTPVVASEAYTLGLVDRLAKTGMALTIALEEAQALAQTAPLALALTKQALSKGLEQLLDDEVMMQAQLFLSKDHQEGKAAFFAKRSPLFKGV